MKLAELCPLLEEKSGFQLCTDKGVLALAKQCHKLRRIQLASTSLSEGSLLALIQSNPDLHEFTCNADGATDQVGRQVAASCRNLTSLVIHTPIAQSSAYLLLEEGKHLATLNVEGSWEGLRVAPTVTSLSMKKLTIDCTRISGEATDQLLHACPGLVDLELKGGHIHRDFEVISIGMWCAALETLTISTCDEYDYLFTIEAEFVLMDVGKLCSKLRKLHIPLYLDSSSSYAIVDIAKRNPGLESVHIGTSRAVTDWFLETLASHCHRLRSVNFSKCAEITDVGVNELIAGCSALVEMDVSGCRRVSKACMDEVHRRFPMCAVTWKTVV